MLALGIVLIVLAILFGLGVSLSSSASTTMSVFGVDFGLAVPTLFFLGAATGIAIALGLWLTKKGLGRGYRRHKEVRELRQRVAAAPTSADTQDERLDADTRDERRDADTRDDAPERGERSDADAPAGRHAADPDDSRAVDLAEGDRLASERHTVGDGTDSKQPH